MPILRSDIEAALNELVSNEGGMKFQGLAVVLAKLRWPDLVASERKNDLGLDAYVSAATAADHVGKGLACSITPKLAKIVADAKEARRHFDDIGLLIFATPSKVSNPKKREWSETIREQFGCELEVISREEIITLLMMPANASLCRSFLGIDVPVPAPIEESIERIRQATADVAESWATRLRRLPLIELRAVLLDGKGGESSDVFRLADIQAALAKSRRSSS